MNYSTFRAMFNDPAACIGTDTTDETRTCFFLNADGSVGEARYNRRTTQTVYTVLTGETADMVRYWYGPTGPRGPKRTSTVIVTVEHSPDMTAVDAVRSILRPAGGARVLSLS
jgi:hypothetical protein